jgi:uncharacterized membrane protein
MNGLQNGTAFFASTSLIAIGGSLTLLQSADRVVQIFADLPFATTTTRAAWEIKVIGLAVIFAYAFFKFGWSLPIVQLLRHPDRCDPAAYRGRQTRNDRGGARDGGDEHRRRTLHFNRGQRAFFFALAYLGWFISALALPDRDGSGADGDVAPAIRLGFGRSGRRGKQGRLTKLRRRPSKRHDQTDR